MTTAHPDSRIIDALGGTAEVARLCECKSPSVSEWRNVGIPRARRQFLELLRPDVFADDRGADERHPPTAVAGEAAEAVPALLSTAGQGR